MDSFFLDNFFQVKQVGCYYLAISLLEYQESPLISPPLTLCLNVHMSQGQLLDKL